MSTTVVGSAHGDVKRSARYGLRGIRVGEASHPGHPRRLLLRSSRRHRSRNRWDPTQMEKCLLTRNRWSPPRAVLPFPQVPVPASFGALVEAGIQRTSPVRGTHHPSQFPCPRRGRSSGCIIDPSSVGAPVVVERVGDQGHSQGRFAVLAMDADDSHVPRRFPT